MQGAPVSPGVCGWGPRLAPPHSEPRLESKDSFGGSACLTGSGCARRLGWGQGAVGHWQRAALLVACHLGWRTWGQGWRLLLPAASGVPRRWRCKAPWLRQSAIPCKDKAIYNPYSLPAGGRMIMSSKQKASITSYSFSKNFQGWIKKK